jgi:CTP:molybdopterin cytidylyltransferase MocA
VDARRGRRTASPPLREAIVTVGAVVVATDSAEALADAAGRPAVRRIIDAAWAGGALPIIVVVPDADGAVAAALTGTPAVLVSPGRRAAAGDAAAAALGLAAAVESVAETSAVLFWPARMTWVDPETATSLIEASGAQLVPRRPVHGGTPGWPVLLPIAVAHARLDGASGSLETAVAGDDIAVSELGDPGSILGREVDLDDLPRYAGPPEPLGGPPPEWGAAAAETPDPEVPADR